MTRALAVLVGLVALGAASASSQQDTVLVEQIAGRDIYVAVGTDNGIEVGDTLLARLVTETRQGLLRVTHTSRHRSILTFAADPFPITRGQRLILQGLSTPTVTARRRTATPTPRPTSRAIRHTGRLTLAGTELRSSTIGLGGLAVGRRLTTTTAQFRSVTSGLPGATELSIRAAANGRFSPTGDPVRTTMQFYEVAVGTSRAQGLGFAVGRFQNPFGDLGDYWDGLLLRAGTRTIVAGGTVGFEPHRGNEAFNATWRKASGFLSMRLGSGTRRYTLEADAGRAWSDDDAHLHVAASQSVWLGRVRLFQRLRADRPADGNWHVTNLQGDLHVPVARGVTIVSRVSRRTQEWRPGRVWVDTTEYLRIGGGMHLTGATGALTVEGSRARTDQHWLSTVTASLTLARLPGLRAIGVDAAAQYWAGTLQHGIYGRGGLRWRHGTGHIRAGYTIYQTVLRDITLGSRSVYLSTTFGLSQQIDVRMVATGMFGAHTRAATVTSSLSMRW